MHALSLPAIDAARRRDYWRARYNAVDSQCAAFRAAYCVLWDSNNDAIVARFNGAIRAAQSLDPIADHASDEYYRACRELAALGVPQ